ADALRGTLGRAAIVWERSAEVAALAVAPIPSAVGSSPLGEMARRVAAEMRRVAPEATVSVSAGSAVADPLDLARSFTEARRALEVGRWASGSGSVTAFDELGAERLLVGVPPATLREFVAAQLGSLFAYDERHHTELIGTLETYLATRNAALA